MTTEIKEMKTVWVVYTNTDLTEGRGHQYPKFVCEKRSTAIRLAKKQGVQGSDADVEQKVAVLVNGVGWLAPVVIQQPNAGDRVEEERIEREAIKRTQKLEIIEKAKKLGLSEYELEKLMDN